MSGHHRTPSGHGRAGMYARPDRPTALNRPELIRLSGGLFRMGSESPQAHPEDGEGPVREVRVGPFRLAPYCVTNEQFAAFVRAHGYVTDAELFGTSFVFADLLPASTPPTRAVPGAVWWREVAGADWRHPEGPGSDLNNRSHHPVVHVSWRDAIAYCRWAGLRLPTEPEWEYAARGGLTGMPFPWGDTLADGGRRQMNVWQGDFPARDGGAGDYRTTAPVDAYPPNAFGLHNMTGNVWEWTADPFVAGASTGGAPRAMRGGSYLCHAGCRRYRVSARTAGTPESSSGSIGFRCAADETLFRVTAA